MKVIDESSYPVRCGLLGCSRSSPGSNEVFYMTLDLACLLHAHDAKAKALDEKIDADQRIAAIRRFGFSQFRETITVFALLLEPRQTNSVQSAAIETLAQFDDAGVAELLTKHG